MLVSLLLTCAFGFVSLCGHVHVSLLYVLCVCACDVFPQALEKAKEAGRKERALVRQREQSGNADHINLDLTYSVSKAAVYQHVVVYMCIWLFQCL